MDVSLLTGLILGLCDTTLAHDPHDHDHDDPPAAAGPPVVSADELRQLQQGVAADNAERRGKQPTTVPLFQPGPPGTAGAVGPTAAQGTAGISGFAAQPLLGAMNPNISLILDTAAAFFSADKSLQTGAHDPSDTGFNLQQLELHIESAVDPYFDMQTNIVFSQFGVEVEEVYLRTLSMPGGLQVRGGQFLAPFGRLNPTHPHSWKFADQPLVNGKFLGSEGLRGLGAEVSWLLPLPWYAELTASTQMGKDVCCGRSFWGGSPLPVRTMFDLLGIARLAQFFPIDRDWSVMWGLSAAHGPNASGHGNRTDLVGTDVFVRYRPVADRQRRSLSWHSELMMRNRQVPGRLLSDLGWMAQLVWQYALRWEVGARAERVTGVENDPLDPDWTGARARYTAQWTFYPSHFSRLRAQASVDSPAWRDPIYSVFFAAEVLIGAHGAHKF